MMFKSILIANRGEIAVRIIRTLKHLNIRSIAIYSSIDCYSSHVFEADNAIEIKDCSPSECYLRGDLIIEIALKENVQAIIPGYGFLSENSLFAQQCQLVGIIFIGPTYEQIYQFGLKHIAYELAREANLPLLSHSGLINNIEDAKYQAQLIGYPIMLKSTAGSGGNGMAKCLDENQLIISYEKVRRAGEKFLKNDGIYLEQYIDNARHIEIQIFGDGYGHVMAFTERDCSLQRRNQKIIEETPSIHLSEDIRYRLRNAAIQLGKLVKYQSVGTVEFIYDRTNQQFYFLEVNCRLQVEHPITELIYGIDFVEWMIRLSCGNPPDELYNNSLIPKGVAIEVRLCSEEPLRHFYPCSGIINEVSFPSNVRVDTWISNGTKISPFYDSLLAKIIVHAKNREEAIHQMYETLQNTRLFGIGNNLDFLSQVISSSHYFNGDISTSFLTDYFKYQPNVIEILEGGTYTTIQDYPGRIGHWNVGIPPSGPMDDYAFRLANRLVGNEENAAGLECTLIGPTIRFHISTMIVITGAQMNPILDNKLIPLWKLIHIESGQILKLGRAISGCRTYIAIRGGFNVPIYLGSRSTFVLGQFGGYAGRTLNCGDILFVNQFIDHKNINTECTICDDLIPNYPNENEEWQVGVLYGPHGAPDFFTNDYIKIFFNSIWKVHHNSNRLGIRLLGPKPNWSRSDGGEAGLHPSNIHDCEYAIGSINFTGDTPIILTRDGPSLGGFVCPVTIIKSELWKIGQVKPNDRIQFYPLTFDQALIMEKNQEKSILTLKSFLKSSLLSSLSIKFENDECILMKLNERNDRPSIIYRQAGDHYILIEYGNNHFDLRYRFRVHFLMEELLSHHPIEGIQELSPGVRSLQIHYDSKIIHQQQLLAALLIAEDNLPNNENEMKVNSRIIYLPLAFEDSKTLDAVQRYRETVKESAPWLPNNIDFIQRINGLSSREDVQEIIFNASYLILGLGDVYLGAPCALPIDPRHRLLTSKYNPARTYTGEGTVGIGGVYMCIYGMDSPGGYQLIGRTLPIWNTFNFNSIFKNNYPWFLKFFDQIRFYPVTEKQLQIQRHQFRQGRLNLQIIEDNQFHLSDYMNFLEKESKSINTFLEKQNLAFLKEVSHWQNDSNEIIENKNEILKIELNNDKQIPIKTDICGSIWKILCQENDLIQINTPLIILEAMKMELIIRSPINGKISSILCHLGQLVDNKDILIIIES